MKILCFHNPDEENGYLSNWYLSEFNVSNITFSSMEQFMMYQKAMCFCDQTIAKKILTTHDVAQVKKFGRQVSNYNENRWNGIRQIVVYEGLLAKFSQKITSLPAPVPGTIRSPECTKIRTVQSILVHRQ